MLTGNPLYSGRRNSYTDLNEVYFWTITVKNWRHLLQADENKMVIIASLQWLVKNELIRLFGFVIMPNHIHLMWEQLKMNGKEFPKNSFEKFTARHIINSMKIKSDPSLNNYAVTATDRKYNIWLRDPLAMLVTHREMASQKLDYMHLNPMQPHWLLCEMPAQYRFSSASFYENNVDEFGLLTHYREVF